MQRPDAALRWADELRELLRRFARDLQQAFQAVGNRDPNDPRVMTVLLVILFVMLAVVNLQQLLLILGRQ